MAETKQIQTLNRAASFIPDSYNEANNTIDVVAATEDAKVLRYGWEGMYFEVLGMNDGEVRMQRINSGANVLDNHDRWSSVREAVVGVVEKAWIQDRKLHATIRFSTREDLKPFIADVRAGIIRNISIGYNVYKYQITEELGQTPEYRAIDWEPGEISFVSVPADFTAGVRNQNLPTHEVEIISNHLNRNKMPEVTTTPEGQSTEQQRSQTSGTAAPVAATTVDAEQVRKEATKAALQRSSEILKAVRAAGFDAAYAQTLIDDENMTLDGARAAIISKLAEKQSSAETRSVSPTTIIPGTDETDKRRAGMENAILVRAGSAAGKKDQLGEYRGAILIDLARMSVEAMGVNTRGLTQREIALVALNNERSGSNHSTSDFPIILGNVINRTLRQAYDLAPRTFQPFVRQTSARDFREMTRAQLGDLATLDEVKEGGEYKEFTIGESAEKYKVAKYGKIFSITWETLVNDDLDAFSRVPAMFGAAAAQKQSDLVYAILTGNPNMSDSVALFHANHGNLAASGTAISVASLGACRAAMRKQKSPGGSYLNLMCKYLIVGPDKESEALQFTSQNYVAAKSPDINVWAGMMTPIVEARLTGNQWYCAADPSQIDTIETAFLDGEELFTEVKQGFSVDGMKVKARMVFGTKAIDYRGLYKNPGA